MSICLFVRFIIRKILRSFEDIPVLDALTHAIEAYLSNQASMISDALALYSADKSKIP